MMMWPMVWRLAVSIVPLAAVQALGDVPATPVMTVYRFNGPLDVPFYDADSFARRGPTSPAGTLAQGTSVVPCLVIRDGAPLTDAGGTPYVGFEIVVDSRRAVPADTARYKETVARRKTMRVENHHCAPGPAQVIDVRQIFALDKPPSFDPPPAAATAPVTGKGLDAIVRAFHASPECADAHRRLIGRRAALARAWEAFSQKNPGRWSAAELARARNLDYVMRTALYEGHLDRGCSAYGACERNVIALSIRNRGVVDCRRGQGCRFPGDFEGVASSVSQYNIWDEFLTQVSGLTSCFLRPDLEGNPTYTKIRAMYAQSVPDVQRILFGSEADLAGPFPQAAGAPRSTLRHYYHPPAMGKCLPGHPRVEFMTGAIARNGGDFVLIAGTRIEVGAPRGDGYLFREAEVRDSPSGDVVEIVDAYPGFVVDGRKVSLRAATGCRPYGTPSGCRFERVGRHRKVPSWLASGRPMVLTCRVEARGAACDAPAEREDVAVGGPCDVEMQPIAGVP